MGMPTPQATKWNVAGVVDPPISSVDPRELGRGPAIDGAGRIGGAVERRVVAHDGDPIGGEVYVQLQPVGTGGKPTLERGHGVLRAERAAAPVGKHAWHGRSEERHD